MSVLYSTFYQDTKRFLCFLCFLCSQALQSLQSLQSLWDSPPLEVGLLASFGLLSLFNPLEFSTTCDSYLTVDSKGLFNIVFNAVLYHYHALMISVSFRLIYVTMKTQEIVRKYLTTLKNV